jgi:hypothetical protein
VSKHIQVEKLVRESPDEKWEDEHSHPKEEDRFSSKKGYPLNS